MIMDLSMRITTWVTAIVILVFGLGSVWHVDTCLGFRNPIHFPGRKSVFAVSNKNKNKNKDSKKPINASFHASKSKTSQEDGDYWFHEDIHTLGNTGVLGGLHAAMAPLSTKLIDLVAYNGKNVRETIANRLLDRLVSHRAETDHNHHKRNRHDDLTILDLGCGVGMSTRAIASALRQRKIANTTVIGIDTSPEMLAMARTKDLESAGLRSLSDANRGGGWPRNGNRNSSNNRNSNVTKANQVWIETEFLEANAERTPFSRQSFDLVTIMYVLHEAPFRGRDKILREARRVLKTGGILAVVDISPDYQPSPSMLSGEPYLRDYQQNLSTQLLSSLGGFEVLSKDEVVPGHVVLYALVKSDSWWRRFFFRHSWRKQKPKKDEPTTTEVRHKSS